MNSRNTRPATFYNDQVAAYQRSRASENINILDHLQNTGAVITSAIIVLTVLASFFSPDGSLEGGFTAIGSLAWDAILYIIPAPLLFAADSWLSPASSSSLQGQPQPMRNSQQSTHAAKSEALRRVMGLDRPGDMMSSIFRARTRALSVTGSVLGLKTDHDRPPGLGNRDNSCYQNSILQGLASLSSMPDYLATCIQGIDLNGQETGKNVAQTLRTLISDLNDVTNNGRTLWTPSLLKSMSTWTQQDAQEYYSVILDDIDKGASLAVKSMASAQMLGLEGSLDAKDEGCASEHSDDSGYQSSASSAKPAESKTVRNPLEGLLAQRVSCVQCGHSDGLSMVPFNCLTLSLGLDKHQHDLYERLDSYSKVETIEGVDCPKCTLLKAQRLLGKLVERLRGEGIPEDKLEEPLRRLEAVEVALEEDHFDENTLKNICKIPTRVSTTKTKQMVIARPPHSLVIHVNRSVFDPSTFDMIKNSAPVNFPMVLDLGPWCLGSVERKRNVGSGVNDEDEDSEEQWELDPMISMVAGDLRPSRLTGPIYELKSAVTHYGRHENGHYICYRKYPTSAPPQHGATKDQEEGPTGQVPDGGIDDDDAAADEDDDVADAEDPKTEAPTLPREMEWWRLSDHNVSKVDEEIVMGLSPGVFMLFYECIDPSMILQSAVADGVKEDSLEVIMGQPETGAGPGPPSPRAHALHEDDVKSDETESSMDTPRASAACTSVKDRDIPKCTLQEADLPPSYEEVMRGDP